MDASGDVSQAFRTVINRIEACHGCQEGLSGTDIGGRFLTLDVLLAGLQSQAVGGMTVCILRDTDDTSGDRTLVLILRCEESGGGTTVEHRDTETLAATKHHIRTPLSRRSQ